MSLFGRKEKQELEFLRSQMTPQQLEAADLTMKIKSAREELADITAKIAKESSTLSELKKQVIETDERITCNQVKNRPGVGAPGRYGLK